MGLCRSKFGLFTLESCSVINVHIWFSAVVSTQSEYVYDLWISETYRWHYNRAVERESGLGGGKIHRALPPLSTFWVFFKALFRFKDCFFQNHNLLLTLIYYANRKIFSVNNVPGPPKNYGPGGNHPPPLRGPVLQSSTTKTKLIAM